MPEKNVGLLEKAIAPALEDGFSLDVTRGDGCNFSLMLNFPKQRNVSILLDGFPQISDFRAMIRLSDNGKKWNGDYFTGYWDKQEGVAGPVYWIRFNRGAVSVALRAADLDTLRRLFEKMWENPAFNTSWNELEKESGE
jgi:hypothetical protein